MIITSSRKKTFSPNAIQRFPLRQTQEPKNQPIVFLSALMQETLKVNHEAAFQTIQCVTQLPASAKSTLTVFQSPKRKPQEKRSQRLLRTMVDYFPLEEATPRSVRQRLQIHADSNKIELFSKYNERKMSPQKRQSKSFSLDLEGKQFCPRNIQENIKRIEKSQNGYYVSGVNSQDLISLQGAIMFKGRTQRSVRKVAEPLLRTIGEARDEFRWSNLNRKPFVYQGLFN